MPLIPEAEARRLSLRFLAAIYYRDNITVDTATLITSGVLPVYLVEGTIKARSRNMLGKLVSSESGHTFRMQIDAAEGSIIDYEVT